MTDRTDRRTDHVRRRRVDLLLARVRRARADIVDRGLDAVHGPDRREPSPDADADADRRREADPPVTT
jgi:hypothetical protein